LPTCARGPTSVPGRSRATIVVSHGYGNDQENPDYARQVDLFVSNL